MLFIANDLKFTFFYLKIENLPSSFYFCHGSISLGPNSPITTFKRSFVNFSYISNGVKLFATSFHILWGIKRGGRKREEIKWQKNKSSLFLWVKVKDRVTEKWYVKWGWVGIVNEWWCLWKQQHSLKFDAQNWVSSTSSLIHSSLTFFTSIISLFTLHFKSYLFFFVPLPWLVLKWFTFFFPI